MSSISGVLRQRVIHRAGNRCEYCRLSQERQEATFHIDHVEPQAAAGGDSENNLALACVSCSLRKGARRFLVDPQTGETVPIFNPRIQQWSDHLRLDGTRLIGLTPIGRALVDGLALNRPLIRAIRGEEIERGMQW